MLSDLISTYHTLRLSHGVLLDILLSFILLSLILNIFVKTFTRLLKPKLGFSNKNKPKKIKTNFTQHLSLGRLIQLGFYLLISGVTLMIFGSSIEKSLAIDLPISQGVKIIDKNPNLTLTFDQSRPSIYLINPLALSVEKVTYPVTLDKIYLDYGQNLYWHTPDQTIITLAEQESIDSITNLELGSPLILENGQSEQINRQVYNLTRIDTLYQPSTNPQSYSLSIIIDSNPIQIYQFGSGEAT
ncbi:hypothetical protein KC853_01645 [Candidatus Saccharibacteria bacterium]|nr:hypothetical protein [Candidatus Saccharibacteria bacterium]MCB9834726.1 hypothetical protein [Candidatus Nomurabacteria bacterium]